MLISSREQNLAVQGLDFPAFGDEFRSEIVEEFRMRWPAAEEAEVAWSIDDARAKVMLPDAIGEHAGGKRVVVAGDPLSQSDAALAFIGIGLEFIGFGDLIKDGETGGDNECARLHGVAAYMDGGGLGG